MLNSNLALQLQPISSQSVIDCKCIHWYFACSWQYYRTTNLVANLMETEHVNDTLPLMNHLHWHTLHVAGHPRMLLVLLFYVRGLIRHT